MALNWLRSCSLSVGGKTISGGAPTDLRIVFTIEMNTVQSPNPARFRVYNVGSTTATALKAAEGSTLSFTGGYEGNTGLIYKGDMKQFIGSGHESAVYSYVDLLCADGDTAYTQARVTKTLQSGWRPQDKVNVAIDSMSQHGISLGLTNVDLTTPQFPRGIPLIGMARHLLREVASTKGATWSTQNGAVHIVDPRKPVQSSVVEMTPQSGMVGWAKQTPNGIVVTSLLNANLQVHNQIHLNQSSITEAERDVNPLTSGESAQNQGLNMAGVFATDGIYTIIAIRRTGDTRGQPWYDECTCIAASGGSSSNANLKVGIS